MAASLMRNKLKEVREFLGTRCSIQEIDNLMNERGTLKIIDVIVGIKDGKQYRLPFEFVFIDKGSFAKKKENLSEEKTSNLGGLRRHPGLHRREN